MPAAKKVQPRKPGKPKLRTRKKSVAENSVSKPDNSQSHRARQSSPRMTGPESAGMRNRIMRKFNELAATFKKEWQSLKLTCAGTSMEDRIDQLYLSIKFIMEYLRDFHRSIFEVSGDRSHQMFISAAKLHLTMLSLDADPRTQDTLEFFPATQTVVLGRESENSAKGILWWARTHDAIFQAVGGFPSVTGLRNGNAYPENWNDETCEKIRHAIGQRDHFRPLINAMRLSKQQQDDDEPLITAQDVATLVGIERKSLGRYEKDWPQPNRKHSGRRPNEFSYRELRPILMEQFQHLEFPSKLPQKPLKLLQNRR